MANDYQKINTLFLRDENNIIIPDRFTASEFTYLVNNLWECTEKIDGTNIHFDVDFIFRKADNGVVEITKEITICGRTASAQIPTHLYKRLNEIIHGSSSEGQLVSLAFSSAIDKAIAKGDDRLSVSIYGEGYGAKI